MKIKGLLYLRLLCLGIITIVCFNYPAYCQLVLSSPNTSGVYTAPTSITLSPGFSTAPGQTFSATITAGCTPLATVLSNNQNYIVTYIPRVAGITNPADPNNTTCQVMATVNYFDGLGRPLQEVKIKASPSLRDMVQPIAYDQFGREAIRYLPYTVSQTAPSNGSFKPTAIADQASFYNNPTTPSTWNAPGVPKITFPYAETNFEPSPLNRVVEQGASGDAWQLTGKPGATNPGHTVKTDFATNDATSLTTGSGRWAKLYSVTLDANGKPSLVAQGNYGVNQLYVTVLKEENWKSTDGEVGTKEIYVDKQGRTVLRRQFNSSTDIISTYYVYDDLGNMSYILTPKSHPDNGSITPAVLDQLCFQFRFDERNRLIEKKVPGKGRDYLVYNKLDQPVASQDSVQRLNNQWTFTKYDGLGRVVMSGIYNAAMSRTTLQAQVNAQTSNWETRDNTNATNKYYTSVSFPTSNIGTYLVVNYYDDYNIPNLPSSYDKRSSFSQMTRSLETASITNVLGTSNLLWTVKYYDDNGRVTKTFVQHYFNGTNDLANYDETTTGYDFTNNVTSKSKDHHISTNPVLTIADTYDYDQVGRKIRTWEQINGSSKILITQTDYNERGDARIKHLHSSNNGSTFLQDIYYAYNEHGWMKKDSSALFTMQLSYEDGTSPMYNGNIANQYWGTGSNLNHNYTYTYDKLNRLTSAVSNEGFNESGIDYDEIGNIQHLTRANPVTSATNNFTYNYTGNQLNTVTNLTNSTPYQYDGNGNTVFDTRNGTNITYNLLNLPNTITGNGKNITYVYDAAGSKLRRISAATGSTDYVDGIQYDNGALSFILTEEGRVFKSGTSLNYEYNIEDKIGNTRLTFDTHSGTANTVQQEDYYPFGTEIVRGNITSPKNEYLYNKKELQEEIGQYDYGKRFYDPVIGRFTTIDLLAEKYPWYTTYQFAGNEVPNAMDMDGLEPAYPTTNGRIVAARDGQLQRPLTDPQGLAYFKSKTEVGAANKSGTGAFAAAYIAPIFEAANTLISGKNPDGTKASGVQKATAGINLAIVALAARGQPEAEAEGEGAGRSNIAGMGGVTGRWVPESTAGWSEAAKTYQEQVTGVPAGTAYEVNGVKFDGVNSGGLIEAKSSYDNFVDNKTGGFKSWFQGKDGLVDQARSQVKAANGVNVTWEIGTEKTYNAMKQLFKDNGVKGITLKYVPQ